MLKNTGISIFDLIAEADIIVKGVMLILLLASIWSWTIIIDKIVKLRILGFKTDKFEKMFWSGGKLLEDMYAKIKPTANHPIAMIFAAAMQEWTMSNISSISKNDHEVKKSLKERISHSIEGALIRSTEKINSGLSYLAIVGSSSAFIGLFGTVWGIMNSFQSIAIAKNTNIAIVAPGIAEALLATAIGLVAAIPALISYNIFVNRIDRFMDKLENFSFELMSILSRELDR